MVFLSQERRQSQHCQHLITQVKNFVHFMYHIFPREIFSLYCLHNLHRNVTINIFVKYFLQSVIGILNTILEISLMFVQYTLMSFSLFHTSQKLYAFYALHFVGQKPVN